MARIVVRPAPSPHEHALRAGLATTSPDPLGDTIDAVLPSRARELLLDALREGSACPEPLRARVLAARTEADLDAIVTDLARWAAGALR